jgi:hypothetical protein
MGFLNRFRGGPAVPEWASFFKPAEYEAFIATLEADLRRRGFAFEHHDGILEVHRGGEAPDQLGLLNLAQKCRIADRSDWSAVIAEHFSALLSLTGRDLEALAADFEQVREILRIRLYADESMGGMTPEPEGPVLRPVAPGILMGLVYDFPDSVASVSRGQLGDWPLAEDDVLSLARDNTLAEPPPPRQVLNGREGSTFEAMMGDSFYVASRVLGLGELIPSDNVAGALVGVPNRHVLLWHPIIDLRAVAAMTTMAPVIQQLFRDGPGSITNQLYWWHDDDLIHLPITPNKKDFDFAPPDAFVELLNGLAPPPGG